LMLISIVVVLFIAYWGLGLVLYFMQPALDDFVYLPYTAGEIDGGNLCHRLDDNRRGGADCNLSDIDSFGFSSFNHNLRRMFYAAGRSAFSGILFHADRLFIVRARKRFFLLMPFETISWSNIPQSIQSSIMSRVL